MKHYVLSFLIVSLFLAQQNVYASKPNKIVGLVQVRNEACVIEQCLHALSLYTDGIVVLDDASDDDTVAICQSVATQYHIERIVRNDSMAWVHATECDNRQKLLDAGREIGGTHFIVIDADEMFTANCAERNFLRNVIFRLKPGDRLGMQYLNLWGTMDRFRFLPHNELRFCIFCDNGTCVHKEEKFLHALRVPITLVGGANLELTNTNYGLIHFGYAHWDNILIREAWYKCLERIRQPHKSTDAINAFYTCHKEEGITFYPVQATWLSGYSFFDPHLFDKTDEWRAKQVLAWFDQHSQAFFADLEIWHIDWAMLKKRYAL